MNYFYENVPELQLPDHIQQQLISLDRNSLRINDLCLADGKEVFVGLSYDTLERLDFASEQYNYELGSIITWYLHADLEQAVLDHYADFFGLFSEPPAIRLQYIFGSGVAVHIDQIRSSSIIHPLLNHANTFTRFYGTFRITYNQSYFFHIIRTLQYWFHLMPISNLFRPTISLSPL